MYILGISCFYHDSAAALLRDGEIISAVQEERFTRKRHDASFPEKAIAYCFSHAGISVKDIGAVAFYDKPFLKFERLLETYVAYAPRGFASFLKAMPLWMKEKLWMKDIIHDKLGYDGTIIFPEHHQSHGASAFFPSPFEEAAVLTMDGVGEWATTSFGIGRGNKVELLKEIRFPHSIGLLYSAFTYYAGFKVNSGEYKVMGLAPYGKPLYKDLILRELVDLKDDGSFKLNMGYFDYCAGLTMTNKRFHRLFGAPPRKPESKLTQREMDLARSIQEVTEEVMLKCAVHVRKVTGMKDLAMAGGVALNCVGNGKILKNSGFRNIWIQPAAGDAGGALGAALFAWHQYMDKPRVVDGENDLQKGSFLGPEYPDGESASYLDGINAPYKVLSSPELQEKVADIIAYGGVVGFFQGRMEFGPRALGARSIIGDARSPKMQETMNLKIKFRESFRPFAPSILEEKAKDFFDIPVKSPYMLLVAPVKSSRRRAMTDREEALFGIDKLNVVRSEIPAVTHVDYSARVQTVEKSSNPRLHAILKKLDEKYNCPVIINTSFNVRGEPIVMTPEDAYRCFMRTDMDYLVIGNILLDKKSQKPMEKDSDWRKEFELD